jgi:hypothetical protein
MINGTRRATAAIAESKYVTLNSKINIQISRYVKAST